MEYVFIGLVSAYYTVCCGLMCHSICKEYYDEHKRKKMEYHLYKLVLREVNPTNEVLIFCKNYHHYQNKNYLNNCGMTQIIA